MDIRTTTISCFLLTLLPILLYSQVFPLHDNGRFESVNGRNIPVPDTWNASGVEVVDSHIFTFQPLGPYTPAASVNDASQLLNTPVFQLNRLRTDGTPHVQDGRGGDTLTSLPVAITMQDNLTLSFEPDLPNINRELIYSRSMTVPFLKEAQAKVPFPSFNPTALNDQFGVLDRDSMTYIMTAVLRQTTPNINPLNDTIRTKFTLHFGDVFAYDPPVPGGKNDIPEAAGVIGKGLNLSGKSIGDNTWNDWQFGADGGNGSGRIAVRFTLITADTMTGYQAYFGSLNNGNSVHFALYPDNKVNGTPGTSAIEGSQITRQPGFDNLRYPEKGDKVMNEYTTYLLPTPLYLLPGTYWLSVAQTGSEGFELGASAFRMGMVTTNISTESEAGSGNTSLMAEKVFRIAPVNGLSNTNLFVYSSNSLDFSWIPFMPTTGNPGYAYLDAQGTAAGIPTWSRGTWIPMLRPYFGPGTTTTSVENQNHFSLPVLGQATPNPASVSTLIRFSLPTAGHVRLSLLNSLGTEVARPADQLLAAGEQTVHIETASLPAGVYFYRLEVQGYTLVRQMVVVH